MNIHHLELFYYVARHGGISRAVRNMPYGIQQPAVSSQVILLEEDLGVKLFERQPFRLTAAGTELFDFVRPFFENVDRVADRLRTKASPLLRVGAAELVLCDYLPALIDRLREQQPKLRLSLRSGFQDDIEQLLHYREIDVAIVPLAGAPAGRFECVRLMRLPLVLLVAADSEITSAEDLWSRREIDDPLICLPETELITKHFRQGLQRRRVEWSHAVEASSLDLVARYVANGYGIGLGVTSPGATGPTAVRALPLAEFEPVDIAVLWQGEATPLIRALVDESQRFVAARWPEWGCP